MQTMTYEIEDEATLAPDKPTKRTTKSPALDNPEQGDVSMSEASAADTAALVQQVANKAATEAFKMALEQASERLDAANARASAAEASFETRIKELEQKHSAVRTVVIGYKMNELKPVKFKNGAQHPPKFMPWLLAQISVGKAGGNWPFLFGPAGTGKTTACELAAEVMGVAFGHIACTPDMSTSYIYSRQTKDGFIDSDFIKRFRSGGLFLFDEAANAPGSIFIGINNAMTNGRLYNPITGETIARHPDFALCFADNTNGKGGTGSFGERGRLDGATLNRLEPLEIGYDTELERTLCPDTKLLEILWGMRVKLAEKKALDVVSTRQIKNAYLQTQAGMTHEDISRGFRAKFDASNAALVDECFAAVKKGGK